MHIGYETNTGHVYEGAGGPEFAVVPPPLLTQARLIRSPGDLDDLPSDLHQDALRSWLFREQSFDPVTRIRRGLLFEPFPCGQPDSFLTRGHPQNTLVVPMRGESMTRSLYRFWPCQSLLAEAGAGNGMRLALGNKSSWSLWRLVQVERIVSNDVLVTLKALTAFGILPELRLEAIEERHRVPVQRAIERVLDSAFRESAISVVDQCRNAAVVLLGRGLVMRGAEQRALESDLGALVRRARDELGLKAVAGAGEMLARLHPRGKANEQESKGLRIPQEEDAEISVHAIGFILRELGWAR